MLLWTLLFAVFAAVTLSSPSPPYLVGDEFTHLMPRHMLFFRQATNLQSFEGRLGGVGASAIEQSGDEQRPFSVRITSPQGRGKGKTDEQQGFVLMGR